MIKFNLEDYCQDCPYFEVQQIGPTALHFLDGGAEYSDIELTCKDIQKCRKLFAHISGKQ